MFFKRMMIILCVWIMLASCIPATPHPSLQAKFYVYRFSPPAFVEFDRDFQILQEVPFSVPADCRLFNVFSPPVGDVLSIELSCPNGQTVLFLDTKSSKIAQPVTDSDSHFLAWMPDGRSAYLKVDSLGTAHVARVDASGNNELIPVTEFTYDLALNPNQRDFTYTFSRGLGQGSELWHAEWDGKIVKQLYTDALHYISFARYSPDGKQIAFIKIPDTGTPFTVGELWIMNQDGSNARKLADADAGHGYAASWSPDGKRIAFVVRENPDEERADQSSEALISNVYIVEVESSALTQVTHLDHGRVETPVWSPDGNTLAFNMVIDDRMNVQIADIQTGEMRSLLPESTCCPAWILKEESHH